MARGGGGRESAVACLGLLVVLLTGCGLSSGTESTGSAETPIAIRTPEPTPSSTPAPDLAAVKQVDFGDQIWVEIRRGDKFTLRNGQRTVKTVTWTTPRKGWTYADANGDGYLDALVGLQRVDGNGYEVGYYIWLWNPKAAQAQQVNDVVALTVRCGDEVTKIKPAKGGGFEVSEKLRRASDTTSCFDGGTVKTTRTVEVEDRWLVMTKPRRGYGGVCTEAAYDGIIQPQAGRVKVRLAPYEQAPLAVESAEIELLLDNAPPDHAYWPKGWVQATFRAEGVSKDLERLPCGFVSVKEPVDERESE